MRPVIHSKKHYVQTSLTGVLGGAQLNVELVSAVAVDDINTVDEVVEGAVVKAIYVELWARGSEAAPGSFIYILCKRPGGVNVPSSAEMAALGDWDNKKNVLYTTQGLSNDNDADAIPLYKGWIKIPKSKQRFGLGDHFSFHFFAQGGIDQQVCGFATYKEYT